MRVDLSSARRSVCGPELLAPRALPQLLQDLLQHGAPAKPIQLGR
jgi:hypothetical protein